MPNRLINSTSPYLLQHAHNPVDWYEWSNEALDRARQEDKPILVSIGYSSCHWCHVMERESFENEDIAGIMNEHFVCIKVDREERPDVDQIYMDAVQAMGQHGGWPLNVFLTPSLQPFYGGTYFPPRQWAQLLLQIHKAFGAERNKIEDSAQDLTRHLNTSDLSRFASNGNKFSREPLDQMFQVLRDRFDNNYGGIAKAPKFVMPTIWLFLLRYHRLTGSEEALKMVVVTLEKIGRGGIYDQVAGGFARYSVDERWFAPHFEKMLYDNAQLLTLYAEAFTVAKSDYFWQIITETVQWLEKEMRHPDGGFYSALDADSEGVEGKYYTFTWGEWKSALGNEAEQAAEAFGVTPEGNWEHGRNILLNTTQASYEDVNRWRQKLATAQQARIRPGLDDKIVAGWNCMLIKGLVDTYLALGEERYLELALQAMHFLESKMITGNALARSYKNKPSATEGFLEDYAFLIDAQLSLYVATFEEQWLVKAQRATEYVFDRFFDEKEQYFYFTSKEAEPLIARKKEIFDNVIPSSNSVMARNLLKLGTVLQKEDWIEQAKQMTAALLNTMQSEPSYLSNWGMLATELTATRYEVAIVGPDALVFSRQLRLNYQPFISVMGTTETSRLPLLADKKSAGDLTTVYVCYNQTCQAPVTSVEAALQQLD